MTAVPGQEPEPAAAGARAVLADRLGREAAAPSHPASAAMAEAVRARHGTAAAVLFYGSCLHAGTAPDRPPEGVLDFYLVVDRYRDAYGARLPALANAALPPNVFYLETGWRGQTLRAKYAVVSRADLAAGTRPGSRSAALWARFAQPVRLIWARDDAVRAEIAGRLADSVATLVGAAAPLLAGDGGGEGAFTAEQLWTRGFAETYRTELRAERQGRPNHLYRLAPDRYDALTPPALDAAGLSWHTAQTALPAVPGRGEPGRFVVATTPAEARRARRGWARRRAYGKAMAAGRLVKGAFTFEGGLDYLMWKVERHSGVHVALTPWQRRHPLLAAPALAWRLYRRGAFR